VVAFAVVPIRGTDAPDEVLTAARAARAAWPALSLGEAEFAAQIAKLLAEDPTARCADLALADLYLARACACRDPKALAVFEATLWPDIYAALRRVRLPDHLRQDVLQDLRVALFVHKDISEGRIFQYRGRGSLRGWLRAAALREAWRVAKKYDRELVLDDMVLTSVAALDRDPVIGRFAETCRTGLKQALAAALAQLTAEDRILIRQYYRDGLTVDELAALYRIHRTTASRRVRKARDDLSESILADLARRLKIDEDDVRSVLRLVRSQLELSLDRLLTAA
jgi:RNA polymerase sigma-70 factor (ECF subfamily)